MALLAGVILDDVSCRIVPDRHVLNKGLPEGVRLRGGWINPRDGLADAVCHFLAGFETAVARLVVRKHSDDRFDRLDKLPDRGVDQLLVGSIDDLQHLSSRPVDAAVIVRPRLAATDQAPPPSKSYPDQRAGPN